MKYGTLGKQVVKLAEKSPSRNILELMHRITIQQVASFEVDPMKCFTPLCPDELPVPGGDQIDEELNAQAKLASIRGFSKDAHPENAFWVASPLCPQFGKIPGNPANMDVYWNNHGNPGTYGFELIPGLPPEEEYDFFIYKGVERNMHPYGALYHDFAEKITTGAKEIMKASGKKVVIVGGLATDYCVKETVRQLLEAGFIVILNLAACRGIDPKTTEEAIDEMAKQGAIIAENAEQIEIFLWEGKK